MNPPPQPALPTEPPGPAQETPSTADDDLLAIYGQGLPLRPSPLPPPEAASPRAFSPYSTPPISVAESRVVHPSVQIQQPSARDDLLERSHSSSADAASLESTQPSPSPPDEVVYPMAQYQPVSTGSSANPRAMSQNDKDQLIHSLRTHRVNTITELRRIEKIFAHMNTPEVTQPMTAAWAHYVNSNNLLNELRGLTKNYPFSSDLLDEAKGLVVGDPASVRSWNYCWLVLLKIEKEGLIARHARALATKPTMWGNRAPTAAGVQQLANACVAEWTRAVRQMLRHWDSPPSMTGR